jgi:PmbA protein
MARVSPEDPHACLADAEMLAKSWPDLELYDSTEPSAESLIEAATAAEAAALSVPGVSSSVGAGAGAGLFGMVLATSHGFSGTYERSGFSRSVSVIAGEGVKMERDYDFDSRVSLPILMKPRRSAGAPASVPRRGSTRARSRPVPTSLWCLIRGCPRPDRASGFRHQWRIGGSQDQFSQGHDGQEGRN